jgi:DNA-binding transcriptional LysR family regulator
MIMMVMRLEKLRNVDLNLMIIFAVIAEERSVTKAATRLLLSQPAVSRALQRARDTFQDDLVVRSSSGFELTLRGRKILQELEELLPKIENVIMPSVFDPKRERSTFRISGPDNVCMALLPDLCRRCTTERYKVNFDFLPWQADAADMLEHGKLDLILHIDDGLLPSHFSSEKLYREDWVCAVARQSRFGDRLTLKQYLAAEHITVTTFPSVQNIPDKQLAALGTKRRSSVRIPYFGAALSCLPGTELVLTLTSGMKQMVENNSALRLVNAPPELQPFHFLMVWHPRLGSDSRHTWLREAIRQAAHPEHLAQRA